MSIQPKQPTNESGPTNHNDELPAPEHVPDGQTEVPDLTGEPTQRKNALRIRLPRDPAKREELPEAINGVLTWVLSDVCGESIIESVEILMFPGPQGLEFVLHPRPFALDGRSDTQSTLDDFTKELYSRPLSVLTQAVKRRYPESVNVEVGHLDLEPVGVTDVTTTRLYSIEDGNRPIPGNTKAKPLEELFGALRENHDPFIYQVIVAGEDGSYNMSVRLATYRPKDNYVGDRGFAKLVADGKPTDLERVFGNGNLVSNHDPVLANRYWKTNYTHTIDGPDSYEARYDYALANQYNPRSEIRRHAETVRTVVLGKKEHRRLLNGDTSTEPLLKNEFSRYGWVSLFEPQLLPFVWTVTQRWETNPWRDVKGRSAPVFNSVKLITIETPSQFGVGEGLTDAAPDETAVANEGGAGHGSLEQYTRRAFSEGGDEIHKVDQNADSVPDERLTAVDGMIETLGIEVDSEVVAIECEDENITKGSNTLINAERAYAADRHVVFVYNQADVERGYSHLNKPYKYTEDNGIITYNRTDSVRSPDGRALVRAGDGNTTYRITGQTISVRDDDGELTRGPVTDDVGTFEWPTAPTEDDTTATSTAASETQCGYYRKTDDGTHRVETADGTVIMEYSEKQAFLADWTQIREPHVPIALSYLDFVTVAYRDEKTDQLRVYDPRPDWETTDKSESHEAGVQQFSEELIVERDGAELTYDVLDAALTQWFEGHSQYPAPIRSVIGGHLPKPVKKAKTSGTGNDYRYFDGFDLLFEPGIDSPHQADAPADYDPDDDTEPTEETD